MTKRPKLPDGITIGKDPPANPKDHELWLQPLEDGEPVIMWMYYKGQWVRVSEGMLQ